MGFSSKLLSANSFACGVSGLALVLLASRMLQSSLPLAELGLQLGIINLMAREGFLQALNTAS